MVIPSKMWRLADAALEAGRSGACFTVITGGEPLHHDLKALTTALKRTPNASPSGNQWVDPLSGAFDWITSHRNATNLHKSCLLRRCDELKVVVHCPEDLAFAEAMADQTDQRAQLLPQPGWNSDSMSPTSGTGARQTRTTLAPQPANP